MKHILLCLKIVNNSYIRGCAAVICILVQIIVLTAAVLMTQWLSCTAAVICFLSVFIVSVPAPGKSI